MKRRKKHAIVERTSKFRCPQCGGRVDREIDAKEFRLCGHSIMPQVGDLTSCDRCGSYLEYAADPAFLVLKPAPAWRVALFIEDDLPHNPTLPELVQGAQAGRELRVAANFSPKK